MARHAFLGVLLSILWVGQGQADCDRDHVHLHGAWGQAEFSVEIAQTIPERALGLMNRDALPRGAGMLFVFEDEAPRAFWMKNTRIPLDILYFDGTGRLVSVSKEAQPFDLTPLPSSGPAQYVLEINGGLFDRFRMDETTVIEHPVIEKDAQAKVCAE